MGRWYKVCRVMMAVQVLVDHGVKAERIVLVTYSAGRMGLHRLTKVFPDIAVVVGQVVQDIEEYMALFLTSCSV